MVPNSTRSSPTKLEVTATRWFDSDTTSRSAAAGLAPQASMRITSVSAIRRIIRPRHRDEVEQHRGADHGRGRHAQERDQHRRQQEAAADAHDGADETDDEPDLSLIHISEPT